MTLRLNVGNLDNVQDGFAPIPEDVYKCQVTSVESKTSKASNNPMVVIKVAVVEHPEHTGRSGFINLVLTPDALWKLKQFCKAVRLSWDEQGVDIEQAVGRELFIKVTQETYDPATQGKTGPVRIQNRFDDFVVPEA